MLEGNRDLPPCQERTGLSFMPTIIRVITGHQGCSCRCGCGSHPHSRATGEIHERGKGLWALPRFTSVPRGKLDVPRPHRTPGDASQAILTRCFPVYSPLLDALTLA
jgi:hypothetical protein